MGIIQLARKWNTVFRQKIFSETPDLNEIDKQFKIINVKLVLIIFVVKNIYLQEYVALLLVWTL